MVVTDRAYAERFDQTAGGRMRSIGLICLLAPICAMGLLFQVDKAHAQCAAQDVAKNRRLLDDPALFQTPEAIQAAAGTPVWKTIKAGTVQTKWDLYRALDAAHCELGDAAEDMFAQPAFAVSAGKIETDLVSVSLAHLGLARASLQDVYARAQKLGFALAPAEIGPQLRLRYFEQPLGEFLNVAMAPIQTTDGKPKIFVVGNGGAGLLLIGTDIGATEFHAAARFIFVRQRNVASSTTKSD
jgi:hypothetical protein